MDTVGLGDHPALDFLNSIATPVRDPVELLTGGPAYLAWLERAGFIDAADRAAITARFGPAELDAAAARAVGLREWLRPVVAAWAAGDGPGWHPAWPAQAWPTLSCPPRPGTTSTASWPPTTGSRRSGRTATAVRWSSNAGPGRPRTSC